MSQLLAARAVRPSIAAGIFGADLAEAMVRSQARPD
jgi:hypothetical protein